MPNKIKLELLLYKIAQAKKISLGAILTIIFTVIIILMLEINIFMLGFCVYLFSLYIVCYFLTNKTLKKYQNYKGEFYMDKDTFHSFFANSYILKTCLLSLLPIVLGVWWRITVISYVFIFDFSLLNILFTIIFIGYCFYSVKRLISTFVIIVFITKIIQYVCSNNLTINK